MGMAPDAKMVAAAGIVSTLEMVVKAMEFFVDPDGNPATNDSPKAVNNSWGFPRTPAPSDIEPINRAIVAWEAAGILPVFAVGNSGPRKGTALAPSVHPLAIAVGAT